MKDFEMTVTVKLNSMEFQGICELLNRIETSNQNNEDDLELNLNDKMFVNKVFSKIKESGKRKASKLEAISSEFKTVLI